MTKLKCIARNVFLSALEAVMPGKLIKKALRRNGNCLIVNGREYTLKNNIYVVGFGKAVYGMALGLQEELNDHIVKGILSVPYGFKDTLVSTNTLQGGNRLTVIEGAKNNLPDEEAIHSATKIKGLTESLSPSDILVVLVSGGGSALLPLPVPTISLEDKLVTIKLVVNAGGSIQQLNTVRKKLSQLKGGQLVSSCPSTNIICLIISDIVKNPLDLIASGPTVFDRSTMKDCIQIFSQLNIEKQIPQTVLQHIKKSNEKLLVYTEEDNLARCNNLIVGSNTILVEEAARYAAQFGFKPFVITTVLERDAAETGRILADIAARVLEYQSVDELFDLFLKLDENVDLSVINEYLRDNEQLCFITAGETTVKVSGNGRGGRNQHLALAASIRMKQIVLEKPHLDLKQVCLLSAGTDGQDGPTDAAGAFCDGHLQENVKKIGINLENYFNNCASYDFFSRYFSGEFLLKTGLTGTNVMDLQILLVDKSSDHVE